MELSTEASYRFERGTDPEAVRTAADRAANLIQQLGGGEVARGIVDVCPQPFAPVALLLRPDRVNLVLGTTISESDMARTLTQLEFGVTQSAGALRVVVPSFRGDVRREADLIEEVARVQGYDRIPLTWPRTALTLPTSNDEFSFGRTVVDTLVNLGMTEIITLSFSCPEEMESIGYGDAAEQMTTLMNPMSEKQRALRMSLIPGIMRTLERNVRRGRADCALFEVGRTFAPPTTGHKPSEILMAAGAIVEDAVPRYWQGAGTRRDFYYLKGIVATLLHKLRCPGITFQTGRHPSLSDKACAEISVDRTACGFLGEIRESVRDRFGLGEKVFLFELNLDVLRPFTGRAPVHEPLPRFPSSGRDIALIVAEHVQAQDLMSLMKSRGGDLVHSLTLFDVYRGPQVPTGMKSLAFSIEYLAPDRTLTDEEVNALHDQITEALAVKFHARVREA
jgi:phenylalanyl-tRNA synthetase beta chain